MTSKPNIRFFDLYDIAYSLDHKPLWKNHANEIIYLMLPDGKRIYVAIEPEKTFMDTTLYRRICIFRTEEELKTFNSNIMDPPIGDFHLFEHYRRTGCLSVEFEDLTSIYRSDDPDSDVTVYRKWLVNTSNKKNPPLLHLRANIPYRGYRLMNDEEKSLCLNALRILRGYMNTQKSDKYRPLTNILPSRIPYLYLDNPGKMTYLMTTVPMPQVRLDDLPPLPLPSGDIMKKCLAKKKNGTWYVDLFMSPSPVRDGPDRSPTQINDGNRHIHPMCFVVFDAPTSELLTFCALKHKNDSGCLSQINTLFNEALSDSECLPTEIKVQDTQVKNLLKAVCDFLGIKLTKISDGLKNPIDDMIGLVYFNNDFECEPDWDDTLTIEEFDDTEDQDLDLDDDFDSDDESDFYTELLHSLFK